MPPKKKFGGAAVDLRGLLAPQPKLPSGPAWANGAGAARAPPPKAAGPPKSAAPAGPAVGGKWTKGGPQGLAATSTSLSAKPAGFAPPPRPKPVGIAIPGKAPKPGGSLPAFDPFDDTVFPEAEKPKSAAELANEKALTKIACKFPQTSTWQEALAALCDAAEAAGAAPVSQTVDSQLSAGFAWLLNSGMPEATEKARERLIGAGVLVIDGLASQPTALAQLQRLLEAYFEELQKKGKNTPQALEANGFVDADFYGTLARHLAESDPSKFRSIRIRLARRLIKPTTSSAVQRALADALQPLFALDPSVEDAMKIFMDALSDSKEPSRRGGALGIAAVVKACGASSIKKLGIIDYIKDVVGDEKKSSPGKRQGALLCLEAIAASLGRTFEPYAVTMVPLLLASCSDPAKDVHTAALAAARTIVSQMSSNGVRLLAKPLLEALKDKRWRTQLGAIELMKLMFVSMAAEGPKRLAALLPKAVPALCEAVAGTRAEIRAVAGEIFEQIGATIDHPDVKLLAPNLIAALIDPQEGPVAAALDSLLRAVFTTTIDVASLSFICPIMGRALKSSDADTRKKAASLVRTMVTLIGEEEQLTPYLSALWPQLRQSLSDHVPEVRAAAAKAIGALAVAVGEDQVDWASYLMGRLNESKDAAELDGAALGLAEAVAVVEEEKRELILAELAESTDPPEGRRGRLTAYVFLPKTLAGVPGGANAIAAFLPLLVSALTDSDESIRAVGRRALSASVDAARGAVATPVVESLVFSLQSSDVKARITACELAFELMPNLSKGGEARGTLLVAVILAQADAIGDVRRGADRVWRKASESGEAPGKQLRELRPRLIERIAADLSGSDDSVAAAAGRAAAQLQQRLESKESSFYEDLAPEIQEAFASGDPGMQKSACVGFSEILKAEGGGKAIKNPQLAEALRDILCSEDADVRAAAAICAAAAPASAVVEPLIDALCGSRSAPEPAQISGLEKLLEADGTGAALAALIARASSPPTSLAKIRCLAATAAASTKTLRGEPVASVVLACLEAATSAPQLAEASADATSAIALRLDADDTADMLQVVVSKIEIGKTSQRATAAALMIGAAVETAKVPPRDAEALLDVLLPGLLLVEDAACSAAFTRAFSALSGKCGPAKLAEEGVPKMLDVLRSRCDSSEQIADAAVEAVMPVLQQGVAGASALKGPACEAMALLFARSSDHVVQAGAVKSAGPLVRALGEKTATTELQSAILAALEQLLRRAGATLRPLIPALQTTLIKCLEGPEELHPGAASTLGVLAPLVPKAETLVKALCKAPPRAAHLEALAVVLKALPQCSPEVQKEAQAAASAGEKAGEDAVRRAASKVEGVLK